MNYGAQTYAWQMSIERYGGKIPHILDVCKAAGFQGLEIETSMLGEYEEKPEELKKTFRERNMTLAAIGVPVAWGEKSREEIRRVICQSAETALPFGSTLMSLSLIPPEKPIVDSEKQQEKMLEFLSEMDAVIKTYGHRTAFHTNSSETSLFREYGDYQRLKRFFEETGIGYTPDAGHIVHGGMDAEQIFAEFMPYIVHVHYKDINEQGEWVPMGQGMIPFKRLTQQLENAMYSGWILVEEESKEARENPDAAMLENGNWICSMKENKFKLV